MKDLISYPDNSIIVIELYLDTNIPLNRRYLFTYAICTSAVDSVDFICLQTAQCRRCVMSYSYNLRSNSCRILLVII